jgi:hypothetical protein
LGATYLADVGVGVANYSLEFISVLKSFRSGHLDVFVTISIIAPGSFGERIDELILYPTRR